MFYFGGMTLGYLTPPARGAQGEEGNKMAGELETGRDRAEQAVRIPAPAELVRRANWLSFLS